MSKSETRVQEEIVLTAASIDGALWRNNSGALKDINGRLVRFGLGNVSKPHNDVWKSPDLIGITPMRIEQHHVGRVIGVFTGVEVKQEDWAYKGDKHETAQYNCLVNIGRLGGIGMFAQSEGEYRNVIRSFIL